MIGSRNIVIAHDLGMVAVAWCMALSVRFNFEVLPLPFLAADRKYNRPFWRGRPLLLLNSNPVSRNNRGGLPPFTPKFHGATASTPR